METDEIYWDPYDGTLAENPYPIYRRLRDEMPLYRNDKYDFYAVSRFEDCERGLPDWKRFSSARGDILEIIQSGFEIPSGTLIFEDPPVHDIHRRLLSGIFTPRRIAMLEPRVRDFCTTVLDPLTGADRFDLVEAVGAELPMRVIGMLLGIPEADQPAFRDMADDALRTQDGQPMRFRGAQSLTNEAFAEYIDWRTDHPSEDIMTDLLTTEFEDEHGETRRLTREEILTYVNVISNAGNETTGRLIGWAGAVLAKYPGQRRELVDDPSLIPNAVEELLRYEPTGHSIARYVTEDVEFHGRTVPAGSPLLFMVGAANRDHRRHDDPDRFDVHRRIGQQLTFGLGGHYCLGAALARLEGRIAVEEILKRFPEWDVDWDDAKLAQTSTVRGWETLPLVIG